MNDSHAARDDEATEYRYVAGYIVAEKYRLESLIRRGGMGYVWVARNLALDVDVAVKLIRHELASPHASQRLLTEARAVARLGHPSVVRMFEHGKTEHGDAFVVMELVRGEALDTVLARGTRLPAQRAVQLLLPVASALAAAHAQGIVHRDVKPDNIVLTTTDAGGIVPKLLDFGVAKFREEGRATVTTHEGTTLGSPAYMAPEQALGAPDIDARADVWGFCVVLYEAVTGYRPFQGPTYRAMMDSVLRLDPVSFMEHGVGDDLLWTICARGLAKDPAERWASMRELGRALARWLLSRGIEADAAGNALRSHWLGAPTPHALLISGLTDAVSGSSDSLPAPDPHVTTMRRAVSRRSRMLVMLGVFSIVAILGTALGILALPDPVPERRAETVTPTPAATEEAPEEEEEPVARSSA
ncbi:MAG TPA: serine/threonine-protein kinase, partial [Polyangiaceae bacterium]|nr:serine/threonine-protein kinase [Polyangiaceae bacterium]